MKTEVKNSAAWKMLKRKLLYVWLPVTVVVLISVLTETYGAFLH